jgi:hypothetical protein
MSVERSRVKLLARSSQSQLQRTRECPRGTLDAMNAPDTREGWEQYLLHGALGGANGQRALHKSVCSAGLVGEQRPDKLM